MNNIPETCPAKVPVKHCIDLKDDIPLYENPRRIAYSQREAIKDVIDDLLEKQGRIQTVALCASATVNFPNCRILYFKPNAIILTVNLFEN